VGDLENTADYRTQCETGRSQHFNKVEALLSTSEIPQLPTRDIAASQLSRIQEHYTPYIYKSLEGEASIRLLMIEPGNDSALLQCQFEMASIDNAFAYSALSYVWGNDALEDAVLCDGGMIQVTASLGYALRRVRKINAPILLWADAICVNQADLNERSHQVQMMHKIYSRAKRVVSYFQIQAQSPCYSIS